MAHAMPGSVFNADQFARNVPDGVEDHYWHRARNRIVERRLAALSLERDALILEIGCGRGVVVDHLRRRNYEVKGCELGEPTPIRSELAPHLFMHQDAFELPEHVVSRVRVVLLLDVLEHLEDPAGFLTRCRETFPLLQSIVVTLPARQELFSNYDAYYGHHLRYDIGDVGALARRSGVAVAESGYFFHALYLPARAFRLLDRARAVVVEPPSRSLGWAHRLLGTLFDWEERLLPRHWVGASLYAVLSSQEG